MRSFLLFVVCLFGASFMGAEAQACPKVSVASTVVSYSGDDLYSPQTYNLTAGGNVYLTGCSSVPGSGYLAGRPDVSLEYARGSEGFDLEIRAQGQCDVTLLVNTPAGTWEFNDDAVGLDPSIRIPNAGAGRYDIWVGTATSGNCGSTLTFETFNASTGGGGGGSGGECPQAVAATVSQGLNGDQLFSGVRYKITAGGQLNLTNCPTVPGGGFLAPTPDLSIDYEQGSRAFDFEVRADGDCDVTLLINTPSGAWEFNDDADGLDPRIRIGKASSGRFDIWVGTATAGNCGAAVTIETF